MLEAVKQIGAQRIYEAITSFVSEQFAHEIELPFEDSPDSYFIVLLCQAAMRL